MQISGKIIDIFKRKIFPGSIIITEGKIRKIEEMLRAPERYFMPGLIDSHIHVESSMCTPGSFAEAAVSRGTTAVVSDPHEIANILGIEGVKFMIEDAKKVPLKFYFGAPSCVPATAFETAGATIEAEETEFLLQQPDIKFLAEMMNFPGVMQEDNEVIKKIKIAKKYGKPVDGHAPGLSGENLKKYVNAGISTDHECASIEEATEKISLGMKILIREGSAARNMEALKELITSNPDMVMLCSDDLHPEMLVKRHINKIVAKLVNDGYNLFDVLRACTINPAEHYSLNVGLLRPGDPADFIIVDNPAEMNIIETWIEGKKVFGKGKVHFYYDYETIINKFNCSPILTDDIKIIKSGSKLRVIQAFDGQLFTEEKTMPAEDSHLICSNTGKDILKIVVKDRYNDTPPSVGFIRGFGLKNGAFASSVAHDSHNIIGIGVNDEDIVAAVNEIVRLKGGMAIAYNNVVKSLALPVAGIMSHKPVKEIAMEYEKLSNLVKSMGCRLKAPFMTLSFMTLLVIPELKLSDRGLFDGRLFNFVPLMFD
ncbi:MAG: adenine deaminase [Bacteroidales bacterium]